MILNRLTLYASTLAFMLIDPVYALTSKHIREICRKEISYSKCVKRIKEMERKSYSNKQKTLLA